MTREIFLALLAALLVAGVFLLLSIPSSRRTAHLNQTATQWFENIAERRYEDAYSQMAPAYRSAVGYETFRATVSKTIYVREFRFFQNNSSHFQDDRAEVSGQIGSQSGEFESVVHFVRTKGDGGDVWFVTAVIVAGATIIPMTADG